MMPGINPRQMKKMMQKIGIKQEEIEASEVIIKTSEKNLIIKNPNILKINMGGQDSLQITGEITEESNISEEDISTVAEQANVSKEEARKSLEKHDGDLAETILDLKKE